ncbi:MAG TPA: polysaccharide biosynthesis/export family protein [Nitrospiraceae bacterium]|jgi:polysaccharide export outer membrane protein|nr:polysaccharide biosynthesis/export family protein [Nitrospiraceae bacterium]
MIPVRALVIAGLLFGMPMGCASVSNEALNEASRPVSKEFMLGPEDVLEVTVWRNQDLSRTVVVRPDGKISLPLIGDVQASGLNSSQVAAKIAARLTEFKENPNVSVSLKEVNSYFIFVLGEVLKPGKYPLKSYATVLQGVSMAGGFTQFASKNRMQVIRTYTNDDGKENQIRIPVPYNEMVSGNGKIENFILKSGDTIVVP